MVGARLYDAGRDLHYDKPRWRGWLHLLWFEASLVAGTVLVVTAHGVTAHLTLAVYAVSLSGLFGVSALYHRGTWQPAASRLLQRFDHAMIFLLIAGTATPVFLLALPGTVGVTLLVAVWTVTGLATVVHLCWMHAPEKLVGGTYIVLGSSAGVAVPAVWIHAGPLAAVLMVAGGLLDALGAVLYHRRRPDPWPASFGYHEVFHAFVCAGATCQFVTIALLAH